MKSMSKSELADRACRRFDDELSAMGMLPNAKVLPPHIVKFITEKFAIDVEP